jgi:hypothetical protein
MVFPANPTIAEALTNKMHSEAGCCYPAATLCVFFVKSDHKSADAINEKKVNRPLYANNHIERDFRFASPDIGQEKERSKGLIGATHMRWQNKRSKQRKYQREPKMN